MFVTLIETAPAAWAGTVHVSTLELTKVTPLQAEPPTETVAPLTKSEPIIVIKFPPARIPIEGFTDDKTGVRELILSRSSIFFIGLQAIANNMVTIEIRLRRLRCREFHRYSTRLSRYISLGFGFFNTSTRSSFIF